MIKRIKINSEKIKETKCLLVVSDLHKTLSLKNDNLNKLQRYLEKHNTKIDHILIPGDIINDTKDLESEHFRSKFKEEIKELVKDYPTIVSLGNHDETEKLPERNKIKKGDSTKLIEILESIENVILLNNSKIKEIDGIKYASFNPNLDYYEKYYGAKEEFYKQFMNNYKDIFNEEQFNILLCHDPESIIRLSKEKNTCIQSNTDIVVSGHMHNGFLPPILNFIVKNKGIISPTKYYFPEYAHGEIDIDKTKFVINGAINSRVENPIINYIYGYNATMIEINPKEKVIKR